jgi:UDP-glucose 4-epimerase
MNILITGGGGFIGSNLAAKLSGNNVTVLDCKLDGSGFNENHIQGVEFIEGDVRNFSDMELVGRQDLIFHLAAQLSHTRSMSEPMLDFDINVRGTLNMLEVCRKAGFRGRLVYTGTRGQYGRPEYLPVDEGHKTNGEDINGINKQIAENYCMYYGKKFGLNVVCARLTNIYGPKHQMRHGEQGVLNWFVRKAMDGEGIELFGGGQKRDFLFVEDCVDALLFLSEKAINNNVFNVGSGIGVSLNDAVNILNEIVPCMTIIKEKPDNWRKVEVGDFFMDITKIKQLGWVPRTSLKDGLKKTVEFYMENKSYYW